MYKQIIVLLLIITILSCQKNTELTINEKQFRDKTFNIFSESESEIDTLVIEFQDSTHQVFGSFWQGKVPWRISHYNDTNFLVLDNRVFGIKNAGKDRYNCTYIGLVDNPFTMIERKPKWNKKFIYGTWVKKEVEKYFDNSKNDSIQKPPVPPSPDGFSEKGFKSLEYYEISKDSIKFYQYYSIEKSSIEINNTNEYLLMELGNDNPNDKNWQWNIKSLSNKEMVVERKVSDFATIKFKTDTLIRKSVSKQ